MEFCASAIDNLCHISIAPSELHRQSLCKLILPILNSLYLATLPEDFLLHKGASTAHLQGNLGIAGGKILPVTISINEG